MNAFTLYVAGFFLSISFLSHPGFSAELAHSDETPSARTYPMDHSGWSYKKFAIGSATCTLCVISTMISPTLGLCTTGCVAVLGALYYCRNNSPVIGEIACIATEDLLETNSTASEPSETIITSPPSTGPMPLHRSLSFKDLSKPLKDLQINLLNGAIEGISASTIESVAQILSEKGTLNGISVDYERIIKNTEGVCAQLLEINTQDSIALKGELENFFRHFNSNDIINRRIVIFLLLTSNRVSATEEQYFLNRQTYQALASYFSRLVTKFKELETGKGVSNEGAGVLSLKTLKTEYELLSGYVDKFMGSPEVSDEDLVKLAEISFQITHSDRKDRLRKIFRHAQTLDDASRGILDALTQQSDKELTWHTVESSAAEDIELRVFNLEGFYKVTPFKGEADASNNILTALGVQYEKQLHRNAYKETEKKFYLKIWKESNFLSKHVLDESNNNILKALNEGHYKLIAVAFGKDKSPGSTKRGFYLLPTKLQIPRLAKHDEMREAIIYRLLSPYKNTEENLAVLSQLMSAHWQKMERE